MEKQLEESEVHANVTGPNVAFTGDDPATGGSKRKLLRDIIKRKSLEDIKKWLKQIRK